MKQLFHIEKGNAEQVQPLLSLQIGEKHLGFAISDKTGNTLYELAYCTMDEPEKEGWTEGALDGFLSQYPALQQTFYQVHVAFETGQSVLIPSALYKPGEAQYFLATLHGLKAGSHTISELIPSWQLYNTYSVSDEVYKWVRQNFPAAKSLHHYSLAVTKMNAGGSAGDFLIDFSTENFTLLVARDSQWMLAQCFPYSTPADVVYYLLKTCQRFSLHQKEVILRVSGLIDQHSALYKELNLYFINTEFRNAGWDNSPEFPAHFFTSLNDLVSCAS